MHELEGSRGVAIDAILLVGTLVKAIDGNDELIWIEPALENAGEFGIAVRVDHERRRGEKLARGGDDLASLSRQAG